MSNVTIDSHIGEGSGAFAPSEGVERSQRLVEQEARGRLASVRLSSTWVVHQRLTSRHNECLVGDRGAGPTGAVKEMG